jgi:hypothetical protein
MKQLANIDPECEGETSVEFERTIWHYNLENRNLDIFLFRR